MVPASLSGLPLYISLPRCCAAAFAEACGVSDLEDEVAAALASDLEYKLREMTQEADKFRRHAKRCARPPLL